MRYFVTGATGFIGKRLVEKLLAHRDSIVYFLIRGQSLEDVPVLRQRWRAEEERAIAVIGDLTLPLLGIQAQQLQQLGGNIDHLFHLGAVYNLTASAELQETTNVQGTRNVVEFANAIAAGHFHLVSSIAAAGLYDGVFREDMFEEAENLEHPYFRTKHESERIVREECTRPWRVYRPGIVVGDSRTGEMDKIDGPYYFFKPIQKLRRLLPQWLPAIGIEGGRLNLVPVDFVVDAMDYIAHQNDLDGRCFHLTDPHPRRVGDLLNLFAHAGHAPEMTLRINTRMFAFLPHALRHGLQLLTPVQRIKQAILTDLGLPPDIMQFVNYPTRFDCRDTQKLLAGTDIKVPPLEQYAWKLWDFWERHLDPALFIDRTLSTAVKDKAVVITGGGAGIGRAIGMKLAKAGARVIVIDREADRLSETKTAIEAAGGTIVTYQCDLTEFERLDEVIAQILEEHGAVDVLINNAGRSIRRAIEHSYERFHDFERTMRLNYFGALRLTLGLLPVMQKRKRGHVINISSIGVLTNEPRFSAYIASKAAMDAFARCAASEFADDGIAFTTINMPLVRTAMSAPTKVYEHFPMLTPEQAAEFAVRAIIDRPERVATKLGVFAEVLHAVLPRVAHIIMNTAYRMFPESTAATGGTDQPTAQPPSPDQIAFAELMRGVHL